MGSIGGKIPASMASHIKLTLPVSKVFWRYNRSRDVKYINSFGTVPVIAFKLSDNRVNAVSSPSSEGMVPEEDGKTKAKFS